MNPPFNWYGTDFDYYYVKSVFLPPGDIFFDVVRQFPPPPGILISYVAISYYGCKAGEKVGERYRKFEADFLRIKEAGGLVLLDSGAFTAWSIGHKIDLDEYICFCKDYGHIFTMAVVLDVIGDYRASADNLKRMEDAGVGDYVKLMPVYHHGSPIEELYDLAERYDWVGLGGIAKMNSASSYRWLEEIASLNLPIKYHLFGVSTEEAIQLIKPASVDTSLWTLNASMGRIVTPKTTYDLGRSRKYFISDASIAYINSLADKYGMSFDELQSHHLYRHIFNWFYTTEYFANIKLTNKLKRQFIF